MPQLTAQYGQMVRASLVCASLYGRMAAACTASTSAKPNAPNAVPARPAPAPAKKWRRESSMFIDRFSLRTFAPAGGRSTPDRAHGAESTGFRDRLKSNFRSALKSNKHIGAGAIFYATRRNIVRLRAARRTKVIARGYGRRICAL